MFRKVDYIQLPNLDLSKFDDPFTRKELAHEFHKALTEEGFFTITNHGISEEDWDHQMDLAHAVMTLSPKEKAPYQGWLADIQPATGILKLSQSPLKKMRKASMLDTGYLVLLGITKK